MSLSRPTAHGFLTRLSCAAGLVVAMLGIFSASALAAGHTSSGTGGCEPTPLSNPFARFGDRSFYSPVEGGSFEEGTSGWSLSNAAIVAGNESYSVAGGTHSLAIDPKGEAVSPAFCVSIDHPTMRFFARRTSGSWGVLNVILRWSDSAGHSHDTTAGSLQSGSAWEPSPILALATSLPIWQGGETFSVQIVFKPEQYGGAWAIDDAYIDPRMR